MKDLFKEFRPSIIFLAKFIGLYLLLNIGYALYVDSYEPAPDPMTIIVTQQTSYFLNQLGFNNSTYFQTDQHSVFIKNSFKDVLSVYEGCNGLNVVIIFLSFLLAYGRPSIKLLWFIPLGLIVIHGFNILRISGLYWVSTYIPDFLYFSHKYLFTAILYLVVFSLWFLWLNKIYTFSKTNEH